MDGSQQGRGMSPPLPPTAAQPLDYARPVPADREAGGQGEVIVGVICSISLMVVGALIGIATSVDHGSWMRLFVSVGLTALYCNGLAFLAYRDSSYRRVGVGLWIGLGVAVVIGGACFARLKL